MMNGFEIYGNYFDKYSSRNILIRKLMDGFFSTLHQAIRIAGRVDNIIEIGCGEGYLSARIGKFFEFQIAYCGIDPGFQVLNEARSLNPQMILLCGSIYNLPFPDNTFDMVLIPEVLEHLRYPEKGLQEAVRIGKQHFIISVPNEPIWRIGNCLSGRYLQSLGNTPGHLQHWTKNRFVDFAGQWVEPVRVFSPLPWTVIVAKKKP